MPTTTSMMQSWWLRWGQVGAAFAIALSVGVFVGVAIAERSAAAPPLAYSGVILEGAGPVADGSHTVGLALFTSESGGTALCVVAPAALTTRAGHFSIEVAAPECGTAIEQNDSLWVELTVDGSTLSRSRVGAVPFAVSSERLVLHGAEGAITTGLYCGATAATTGRLRAGPGGSLVGYRAGRALCETACGSRTAHMCSTDEMLRTFQLGRDDFPDGWMATGHYNYSAALVDCEGWTQNLAGYYGMLAMSASSRGLESPTGFGVTCDTRRPVLCCD